MPVPQPLWFTWDGDVMVPLNSRAADRAYVVGQRYHLEHREDRSQASHAHYFSCVNEAWSNLPHDLAERFPSSEALRKWALIKAGYRDERSFGCSSRAEALRLAAFLPQFDDFAVVVAVGATVTAYTAKSQSMRAMGRKEFQASKEAVLNVLAEMIGTSREALEKVTA